MKYFPKTGRATTIWGASFYSEIEAVQAAGLANATRGGETGYYSIQPCGGACCRPEPPDIEIEQCATQAPPRVTFRRLPGMLN
jgi:hypothetical protein